MRLVFMGTPDFAVPALSALHEAGHDIAAVFTRPPRPAGRGRRPRPSPVARKVGELGLPVFTPTGLRDEEAIGLFRDLRPEAAVVAAYGLILPRAVLEIPPGGCLNIHASLLPRWRGAAPIHRAIMAGDEVSGISIMQMDEGLDTGPVLLAEAVPIGPEETTGELHDRLAALGGRLIVEALARRDDLEPVPQDEDRATYAPKIGKEEARVDWARPAAGIDRQIRGLSPFPGAWSEIGGERVKFLGSRLAEGSGAPGEVLEAGPTFKVAAGEGAVEITRLQRAGRAAMNAEEFLRGFPVRPGARLG